MSALAVAAGPADRELDDLDLVAGVRAGDDRAFEILFLRYQPRIAAYVGGMVRDHGRAEDITQEVFMSALRRLREDDQREILFRPWIYEIAKNKCIDAYRRGRRTTELSFDAQDQVGAAEHGRLAEPGPTPDAAVEGKLAFDNLRGAFGGLSPAHHEILVMREFEGLSYREIGERLGMSRPAVESTLFRARKRLGEEYEELVSGQRCLRVQRIVDDSGAQAAGLRDQRRVARHLAHCQPCRRHAHRAGADITGLARPGTSIGSRVAAFLPLPAFLRRRMGGGDEVGKVLGQQAARPAAQWSANVAAALDPGTVSTWAKAAATAATVALAGIGGSAIEHHGSARPSPLAGSEGAATASGGAGHAGAAGRARTRAPRGMAVGDPLPASAAAGGGGSATSTGGERSSADAGGSAASPGAARGGSAAKPGSGLPVAGSVRPLGVLPPAPGARLDGAAGDPVGSVVGAVNGATGSTSSLDGTVRSTGDAAGLTRGGRGLGGTAAPSTDDLTGTAGGAAGNVLPSRGATAGALPATPAPPVSLDPATPLTGPGDSVHPSVSDTLPNLPAPRTSLGG